MSKYIVDNIEYPSVTTVIGILDKGDGLKQWAVDCAIDYIDKNWVEGKSILDLINESRREWKNVQTEAMNIGTEVHHLIERYIKAKMTGKGNSILRQNTHIEIENEIENGFNAFLEWEEENIHHWIESEQTVHCNEYGYAGTLDAIAQLKNGKIYLIDFKSSKGFYDGYDMQVSAYKYGRMERRDIQIEGIGILRLDKETGIPEWKDYTSKYDRSIMAFHRLVEFYYAQKKRRLMNNPFVYDTKMPNKTPA